MACTYRFKGADGQDVTITGKAAMKAALVEGRLDHLLPKGAWDAKAAASAPKIGTINIDGVERPTTNSKGQSIHPTKEGLRNFWRWFGDSKAVDEQGRPLVVHHGTLKDGFSVFNTNGKEGSKTEGAGAFFTDSLDNARSYSITKRTARMEPDKSGRRYAGNYDVYLSIRNPKIIDFEGREWNDFGTDGNAATTDQLASQARKDGYDGVIFKNILDVGMSAVSSRHSTVYVAFHPEQIKSATGNTGAFDPANPDIRFSRRGLTETQFSRNHAGMDDAKNVAGTQAPNPAGDVEQGGATPRPAIATMKSAPMFGTSVSVENNGAVSIAWPGWGSTRTDLRDKAITAVMNEFKPRLPDGVFWRFTNNKNEANLASKKQLRPSTDHSSNTQEDGLSVTDGAHYSVFGYKYGYQVRGEVIGYGADGEPLLDVSTIEPVTKILSSSDVVAEDRKARVAALKAKGWTLEQYQAFANGTFKLHDIDKDGPLPNESSASAGSDAQFSRRAISGSLHPQDAEASLRIARKAFPGVPINLHENDRAETVPEDLRDQIDREDANGDVNGAFFRGEVHLFREAIPGIKTFEFTVAHEMTHAGLSGMFGPEINEVMLHINRSNAEVAARAQELQGRYGYSVARSTEEALADMGGDMVKVKGFSRLVAMIRGWLRKHGFVSRWTDNDIANLVMTARNYARDPKAPTIYREAVFSNDLPNYSRSQLLTKPQRDLTQTEPFKDWFGNSKMKAQDGTPLFFFHGTPTAFDAFDSDKLGSSSTHTSAGLGHFFTRDRATAEKYADGGNVLRGWIKMDRPYVMSLAEAQGFEDTKASTARRKELQKAGYDGAVILDDQGKPWATVAFEPWQFKSTDNSGAFDEFDDRFRFSRTDQRAAGAWPRANPDKLDNWIYTLQDKQIDTRRTVEKARAAGVNVTDEINPTLQEELYHGRVAKRFNDFRNGDVRELLDTMKRAGLSADDVSTYLWAKHAAERNAQIAKINEDMPDGGSGLTNQQAADLLAGKNVTVNGTELKGVNRAKMLALTIISKIVNRITSTDLKEQVAAGLLTQEAADAMAASYENYVPLHREGMDDGRPGVGMGFSVRGNSKRATGSGKTVVDVLGNILNQREKNIVRIEKNRVGQAVLGLAKAFPEKDLWTVDTPPKIKTVESQTVFTAYDKAGNVLGKYSTQQQADKAHPDASVTIKRSKEDQVVERIDPTFRSKDEVFHVQIDGKDHFIVFNKQNERAMRMASALKNLDADQLGAILQVTSKVTRYFAAMATQFNPIWGAVNLTRDVQGALLNLSTTPLRGQEKEVLSNTLSALKGIYADLRAHRAGKTPSSPWAKLFEEMQNEGGQTGYKDMFVTGSDRTEALRKELDPSSWADSPLGKIFTAGGRMKVPMEYARQKAAGFFGWLSDYNETTENAIRLATYKAARDKGLSKQQAASLAKNISVNFNRKGQIATQAGAMYAFFNASMQGSARLLETLRGPLGKKIIAGGISLGVAQAVLLAAAGMGDDEPPEFVRERSFIVPLGDGKYFSIPLPLGFHVLPNLGRIPAEFALGGFKDGAKKIADLFGLLADTFNPMGSAGLSLQTITPTVIDPFAALAENKDWTGKAIYKEDMNGLHPTPGYLRAKDTATAFSKVLAQLINASSGGTDFKPGMFSPTPDQIDYLIGQAFGGVGREGQKIGQTLASVTSGEDLPTYKIPLLGRFYGDARDQSSESGKFYEALKRINMHQAEIKGMRENGRSQEIADYFNENPEARLSLMAQATERGLSELHRMKVKALKADDADRVKEIDSMITERMKAFNERVRAASPQ